MMPGQRTSSRISVVIPTLGRPVLRRALDAIVGGTRLPAELIVVDQGRSTDVEAMLRDMETRGISTRWIPSTQRGRAAGVNRGIEAATTEFVAITDDDCLADSQWIEHLETRLEQEPDTIVTGRVEAGDETVVLVVTDDQSIVQRNPSLRFDRLSGGNMALSRRIVERIGGLDEDPCLRTAEDAEYAYRVLRAHIPIRYAPEATVTHLGWRDDTARDEQYDAYARSHGGFYGKYLRRGDMFIATRAIIHWARELRRWIFATLRVDRERARIARAYVFGLFSGIRQGWTATQRTSP